jgi:hypothetical protein
VPDLTGVLTVVGVVIAAWLGYLGSRFVATASVGALREEVTPLAARVEGLETAREADQAIRERLETEIRRRETRHWSLIAYLRELLAFVHREVPHTAPPAVPRDFVDDLN